MGKKSLSRSKLKTRPSVGDFNQTVYSSSKISFRDDKRRRNCCSGDRDKLKDVKLNQSVGGPPAVNIKQFKKSKSSSKLSSVPAA